MEWEQGSVSVWTLLLPSLLDCVHTCHGRLAGSRVFLLREVDSDPLQWEHLGQGHILHTLLALEALLVGGWMVAKWGIGGWW